MELLISTSLIAAFIAGIAALFAPCCITILLPSYFGSIFREKKKVYLMTFIFFLGILAVFLPLGLGISALGQIFSRFHRVIFSVAALFFLALGILLLTGRKMSLPFNFHPKLERHNTGSVFLMGIFSGIATTCCAPVLAGVLALSILPGSVAWGIVYTLAYVLGIVSPLFLIAFFLDKVNLTNKFMSQTQAKRWKLAGWTFEATIPEIISGVMFLLIGVMAGVWAYTGDLGTRSSLQLYVNIYLARLELWLNGFIGNVPQIVWAVAFVGLFIWLALVAVKQLTKEK